MSSVFGFGLIASIASVSAEEITVWSGFPELAPFYEHVAETMKAEYPDLTVNVHAISLREHEKRIALGVSSGQAAEVIELANATARRYLENELFSTPPQEVADFVSDTANFTPFFQNMGSLDGKVYGVPLFRGQSALYYNKDMFAEAGFDAPPATMADYDTYAEALTQRDADGNPVVSGWSLRLSGGGSGIAEKFAINMFQHGGEMLADMGDGKWRSNFATDAGLATLKQYLHNLFETRTVSIEMPADAEAFERQQTAMFLRESWVIGDIASKAPDLNYATSTLPVGSIVTSVQLYSPAEGAKADTAWNFILETQKPENLVWLLDNVGWLPNRADIDYSEVLAAKPGFKAFVNYPEDYGFFVTPAIGPIDEIMTRMAAVLVDAFGNPALAGDDAAIMAVLQEVDEDVNAILAREGLLAEG